MDSFYYLLALCINGRWHQNPWDRGQDMGGVLLPGGGVLPHIQEPGPPLETPTWSAGGEARASAFPTNTEVRLCCRVRPPSANPARPHPSGDREETEAQASAGARGAGHSHHGCTLQWGVRFGKQLLGAGTQGPGNSQRKCGGKGLGIRGPAGQTSTPLLHSQRAAAPPSVGFPCARPLLHGALHPFPADPQGTLSPSPFTDSQGSSAIYTRSPARPWGLSRQSWASEAALMTPGSLSPRHAHTHSPHRRDGSFHAPLQNVWWLGVA